MHPKYDSAASSLFLYHLAALGPGSVRACAEDGGRADDALVLLPFDGTPGTDGTEWPYLYFLLYVLRVLDFVGAPANLGSEKLIFHYRRFADMLGYPCGEVYDESLQAATDWSTTSWLP